MAEPDGYDITMTYLKFLLKSVIGLALYKTQKKIYSKQYIIFKNSDNINMVVEYSPSLQFAMHFKEMGYFCTCNALQKMI